MAELQTRVPQTNGKLITILSIDGGGVRGVIPGTILAFLESELQNLEADREDVRIADYFDLVAGTSTGALVTAMLTTPHDQNGRPRPATDINIFYHTEGPKIFPKEAEICNQSSERLEPTPENSKTSKNLGTKAAEWLFKAADWVLTKVSKPKYESEPLRDIIKKELKETRLADTLTNVVIPACDIKTLHPHVFSTQQANEDNSGIQLVDVVMSSAAAPYYFSPNKFKADGKEYKHVDGGLAANNPTLLAIREATKMFKNQDTTHYGPPDFSNYLVLSLGTGSVANDKGLEIGHGGLADWFPKLLDLLFQAADDMVDIYTSFILGDYNSQHNFLRIQDYTLKDKEATLDDASKENLTRLVDIGNKLLDRSVSIANSKTGLREIIPNEPTEGDASTNQFATTNREALISFAKRLYDERRCRLGFPA